MALEGDVQIPGAGKVPKKAAAAGLTIVLILIGVYFYRKRGTAAAATTPASSATPANQYPPDGTTGDPSDPYSTDPATGATYGNEAAGSGGLFGAFPPGGFTTGDGTGTTTAAGGPPFADNTFWSNWVIQQLQAVNPNIDTGQLTDALGLYLAGQPVDAAQKTLIYDARAVGGPPPVAGPGNYPPNIRTNGTKGGKTFADNPVQGLRVRPGNREVTISWDKAAHATGYQVSLVNLTAHRTAHAPVTTSATTYTFTGLTAGDTFEATVLAKPAEKGASPAQIQAAPIAMLPQHAPSRR